jgi:hypothetical protein
MTTAESQLATAFGLEGEGWQRHANPWSVYTRIPVPALLAAAVWSRRRLGRWSLLPVGLVCVWTTVNPTAFPPPRSMDNWASKAVLGELVWSRRRTVPVPARHRVAPWLLTGLNAAGLPFLVRGLVVLDGRLVVAGLAVHMAGKLWFLDRMVWLHEDVTGGQVAHPGPDDATAISDWP